LHVWCIVNLICEYSYRSCKGERLLVPSLPKAIFKWAQKLIYFLIEHSKTLMHVAAKWFSNNRNSLEPFISHNCIFFSIYQLQELFAQLINVVRYACCVTNTSLYKPTFIVCFYAKLAAIEIDAHLEMEVKMATASSALYHLDTLNFFTKKLFFWDDFCCIEWWAMYDRGYG